MDPPPGSESTRPRTAASRESEQRPTRGARDLVAAPVGSSSVEGLRVCCWTPAARADRAPRSTAPEMPASVGQRPRSLVDRPDSGPGDVAGEFDASAQPELLVDVG